MNTNNEIAVVVPMYNAEKKIKQCINSILKQTFNNFNLIIVDDGSTDLSKVICDEYAKKDGRVVVIHQENKGCVEARKTGVQSNIAQNSKYIMFCDADDTMPHNALETLYNIAQEHDADCVCGDMVRMIHGIKVPKKHASPCFNNGLKIYDHDLIMKDLYVSCFGVSDYPVNLVAKLYKRELITEAIDFKPIVEFMGEDLCVTLNVMPHAKKLAITPKCVYHYRMGGSTSKFMSYMLDDFLSLYNHKIELMDIYSMDEKTELYLDIELVNIVYDYLQMCKCSGKFSELEMNENIIKCINIKEVKSAIKYLEESHHLNNLALMIKNSEVGSISEYVNQVYKNNRLKRLIKKLIF